jgi:hypothetical protein
MTHLIKLYKFFEKYLSRTIILLRLIELINSEKFQNLIESFLNFV